MCKNEIQRNGYNAQFSANSPGHRTFLDAEHTLENTLKTFISFFSFSVRMVWSASYRKAKQYLKSKNILSPTSSKLI